MGPGGLVAGGPLTAHDGARAVRRGGAGVVAPMRGIFSRYGRVRSGQPWPAASAGSRLATASAPPSLVLCLLSALWLASN